jgi:hypothetical protein
MGPGPGHVLKGEFTYGSSNPFDLRKLGWSVAVHNDYRVDGKSHTFWLFTRPRGEDLIALIGEGMSDTVALDIIRKKAELYER